jgi:hypothetical protein
VSGLAHHDHDADEVHERKESLWALAAAPGIWAGHFLLSYVTASVWCAKLAGPGASLGPVRTAIAAYTVVALAGIGLVGWSAHRRGRYGSGTEPHDFDSPHSRHRFLGFATLLLAGLSAVATVYSALAAVFVGTCH